MKLVKIGDIFDRTLTLSMLLDVAVRKIFCIFTLMYLYVSSDAGSNETGQI